jgi:hypothetical protein
VQDGQHGASEGPRDTAAQALRHTLHPQLQRCAAVRGPVVACVISVTVVLMCVSAVAGGDGHANGVAADRDWLGSQGAGASRRLALSRLAHFFRPLIGGLLHGCDEREAQTQTYISRGLLQ